MKKFESLIDKYGELVEKKKELEGEIAKLKEEILAEAEEKGVASLTGKTFTIEVRESLKVELDPEKVLKKIPKHAFPLVFSVKNTEAKKWLTPDEIEAFTMLTIRTVSLVSKRIKNGK